MRAAVRRNQQTLEWEPELAESWELSADEKTVTFTLRDGLLWSDGDDLTLRDLVDAVNLICYNEDVETSTRNALMVGGEKSVWEVIDDRRFRITLPSVYAGVFNLSSVEALAGYLGVPLEGLGATAR